jgi:tRNA threonylcarbamoyladenosine biosynthesis protein TsaB
LQRLLALDTSTERLSVALGAAGAAEPVRVHQGPGGAQASATLIPTVLQLLASVGWPLSSLDAIAFGCGPGAFTGLRTACAVVQGLALGGRPGGIPVLPVNTLLATAEGARAHWQAQGQPPTGPVLALLDARMDEVYAAWAVPATDGTLQLHGAPWLCAPETLQRAALQHAPAGAASPWLAGNALAVYPDRLAVAWPDAPRLTVWPDASALLRLAPGLWAAGAAVTAAQAQPLYVRDKVALTTEEREQARQASSAQA